jgi:cardiolipin synthase
MRWPTILSMLVVSDPQQKAPESRSGSTLNIPNLLTVSRILIAPLFVIFLLRDRYGLALLAFVVAGVTDGLDGFIARWFNQRSTLGALLDPIADKMLITAAFITLAVLKIIPSWLTVIVISRDVVITLGVAVFSIFNIDFKIKPTVVSKLTTFAQLTSICLVLLDASFSIAGSWAVAFFWIAAGLTVLSGLHYTFTGLNILQRAMGGSG